MPLLFVDETDTEGWITNDCTIEYDGPENVEEYVSDLRKDAASCEEITEDIILGMVHDLGIQEVKRAESARASPSP